MVKTLNEINDLLKTSNNKVTYHWSRAPGLLLHEQTGAEVKISLPNMTIMEWYETSVVVLKDLNEEMDRLALSPLSETDKICDAYVSPEMLTLFEHMVTYRSSLSFQHNHNPINYSLGGTIMGRNIWVNAFHPTNLVVLVPEDPKSVLGVMNVRGFSILDHLLPSSPETGASTPPGQAQGSHNPLEATRLEEKEPIAKTTYKTEDQAWIAPKIPTADKVLRIKFKKMSETAKIPTAIRDGDIGFDLYCDEDWSISPGYTVKIKTNIQLADMPTMDNDRNRIFLKIEGRSGLSAKGIFPTGGIIDPTYRGEIGVVLNCSRVAPMDNAHGPFVFLKGDRIAQLVIYKVATAGEVAMEESNHVTETNRGSAGFGSSGS